MRAACFAYSNNYINKNFGSNNHRQSKCNGKKLKINLQKNQKIERNLVNFIIF